MNKITKRFSLTTICILMTATVLGLVITGCSKETKTQEKSYTNSTIDKSNPFNIVPGNCSVIGKIDVASLAKLDVVKKQIEANKNVASVKELEKAGMGWDNIDSLYFGIASPEKGKKINTPEALIMLKTNNKIDIDKLVSIIEGELKSKVTPKSINNKTAYSIPQENGQIVILVELNDKLLAIGSEKMITNTISLLDGKGTSVISNAEMMQLTDKTNCKQMIWMGCIVNDDLLKSFGVDPQTVQAKGGLLYANYVNDILTIGGNIECATQQDAQKILMPTQMLTAMFVTNPNTGIKPEDVSLKVNGNELNIKISLTKEVLEKLAKQQIQNLPVQATEIEDVQVTVEEPIVSKPAKAETQTPEQKKEQPAK